MSKKRQRVKKHMQLDLSENRDHSVPLDCLLFICFSFIPLFFQEIIVVFPPFFVTTDTPFRQLCINNPPTFKVGYICCSFPLLKIPALILFDFIHAKVILNSTNGGVIASMLLNMARKCCCRTCSQCASTILEVLGLLCSFQSSQLCCNMN